MSMRFFSSALFLLVIFTPIVPLHCSHIIYGEGCTEGRLYAYIKNNQLSEIVDEVHRVPEKLLAQRVAQQDINELSIKLKSYKRQCLQRGMCCACGVAALVASLGFIHEAYRDNCSDWGSDQDPNCILLDGGFRCVSIASAPPVFGVPYHLHEYYRCSRAWEKLQRVERYKREEESPV